MHIINERNKCLFTVKHCGMLEIAKNTISKIWNLATAMDRIQYLKMYHQLRALFSIKISFECHE